MPSFKLLRLQGYGVRWQKPVDATGRMHLTFAIATGKVEREGALNCQRIVSPDALLEHSRMPAERFRQAVGDAFAAWEAAADLRFEETADAETADIVIGAQGDPEGWAFADVQFDPNAGGAEKPIRKAAVCLNPTHRWKLGFDGNLASYDIRYTLTHEIGHAIGLDHPSATGQVMSYRYDERQNGLQTGDLAGVAALYGTPQAVQTAAHAPTASDTSGRVTSAGRPLAIEAAEPAGTRPQR